jgi:hypothetical protein
MIPNSQHDSGLWMVVSITALLILDLNFKLYKYGVFRYLIKWMFGISPTYERSRTTERSTMDLSGTCEYCDCIVGPGHSDIYIKPSGESVPVKRSHYYPILNTPAGPEQTPDLSFSKIVVVSDSVSRIENFIKNRLFGDPHSVEYLKITPPGLITCLVVSLKRSTLYRAGEIFTV